MPNGRYVDQIFGNPTVVNFQADQPVQQRLENGYALDWVKIRLTGSLTLASYSAAPTKFVESVENLIGSLQLSATGNGPGATTDQLCAVDGPFLRLKPRILQGTDVKRTDVGTANGTYAFETNLTKFFIDPRSDKPGLTRLFTANLASLIATYQFRDASAMVTGGTAGTATLSGVQLTTQARMWLGLTSPNPSPYVRETQRTINIAQSATLQRFDSVPTGNILRRQYWKGMVGPTAYADPSDTLFGSSVHVEGPHVQLQINNTTTVYDMVYNQLQADNKALFNVENMPSGYAIYEPSGASKKLSNSLRLASVLRADNYADVNYTGGSLNTIQITDEQIVKCSDAQYNAAA